MLTLADVAEVIRRPEHLDTLLRAHGAEAAVDGLRREGVAAYVAWLRPDAAVLADDRRRAVLKASVDQQALREACGALVAGGVTPLVFKGAAWAVTEYPEPWCRPHLDMDLLVAPAERAVAFRALEALGYQPAGRIPGDLVNSQEVFTRAVAEGVPVTIDLHWRVSNRIRVASMLPADGLIARGAPAPFAGPGVLRASDLDGLFIACLHPMAHHAKAAPLVWALDVALLARRFGSADLAAVRHRAASAGVSSLIGRALEDASALVPEPSRVPLLHAEVIAAFHQAGVRDRARRWLDPDRDQLDDLWEDLRALPSWRLRAQLLREHVCPPVSFMLAGSGPRHRAVVPFLYVSRLIAGGGRWVWGWARDRWVSRRAG